MESVDLLEPLPGLLYEKRDRIAFITLDRPERGNALFPPMRSAFHAIWEDIRADRDVRAVVVTGAGERHFCTGVDLVGVTERDSISENIPLDHAIFYTARQMRVWKPVIVAVNGTVAGGGLHFVTDADIVVAAENASFLDTHVNVGQVGGLENVMLARRVPLGTALRMSLQGRSFRLGAERAYQLGLVDELTPVGQALAVATDIAVDISRNSPQAVTLTQQAVWHGEQVGAEQALEYGWSLVRMHRGHPDSVEGPRAFAERRDPVWNPDPDARRPARDESAGGSGSEADEAD